MKIDVSPVSSRGTLSRFFLRVSIAFSVHHWPHRTRYIILPREKISLKRDGATIASKTSHLTCLIHYGRQRGKANDTTTLVRKLRGDTAF